MNNFPGGLKPSKGLFGRALVAVKISQCIRIRLVIAGL